MKSYLAFFLLVMSMTSHAAYLTCDSAGHKKEFLISFNTETQEIQATYGVKIQVPTIGEKKSLSYSEDKGSVHFIKYHPNFFLLSVIHVETQERFYKLQVSSFSEIFMGRQALTYKFTANYYNDDINLNCRLVFL